VAWSLGWGVVASHLSALFDCVILVTVRGKL
jgi:hypothetical protein